LTGGIKETTPMSKLSKLNRKQHHRMQRIRERLKAIVESYRRDFPNRDPRQMAWLFSQEYDNCMRALSMIRFHRLGMVWALRRERAFLQALRLNKKEKEAGNAIL